MTFDPRARANDIASDLCVKHGLDAFDAIESALLAFAREVLTAEPDEGMMRAGRAVPMPKGEIKGDLETELLRLVSLAMSAHRAKSLEEDK